MDTCNYHDLVWSKKLDRQLQIWHQNIEKWSLDVNKDDAFASIKMQGLIGNNYVSIDPGGSGDLLRSGEMR